MDIPFTESMRSSGYKRCFCPKCKGKPVSRKTFGRHGKIREPPVSSRNSSEPEAGSSRLLPTEGTAMPQVQSAMPLVQDPISIDEGSGASLAGAAVASPSTAALVVAAQPPTEPSPPPEDDGLESRKRGMIPSDEDDSVQKRARADSMGSSMDVDMDSDQGPLGDRENDSHGHSPLLGGQDPCLVEQDPPADSDSDSDDEFGPSRSQVQEHELEMARQADLAERLRQEEAHEREAEAARQAAQAQPAAAGEHGELPDDDLAEYLADMAESKIEKLKESRQFMEAIQNATLDNGKLSTEDIERLRNPPSSLSEDLQNEDVKFSLDLYMSMAGKASEAAYTEACQAIKRRFNKPKESEEEPRDPVTVLSVHSVKKLMTEITGITPIRDDMCPDGHIAYVGPYEDLTECPVCHLSRYQPNPNTRKSKKVPDVPRQQMITIPLGAQLQALRQSEEGATAMRYRARKLAEMQQQEDEDGDLPIYDDLLSGAQFRDLADNEKMTEDDITVGFSFDGAQLYRNKQSDTWIGVWIVYDLHPTQRYKRKHILPALIVPGPKKPSNIDSFLFRSFHHLSALQRENNNRGMKAWDALKQAIVLSRIFFVLGMADTVALRELDGRTGHHAAHPCRVGCDFVGRFKDKSGGHYYSAHLRPNDAKRGSDNPDFDVRKELEATKEAYDADLRKVLQANSQKEYETLRRDTGLSKPSLVSGLLPSQTLLPPHCFSLDLMHLIYINVPQLIVPLFRGEMRVEQPDKKGDWDWVVLVGSIWDMVGEAVQKAGQHYPSHFHRPPRNPCEKISSGYKATEYYKLVFDLFPAFLHGLLEEKYWRNLCRLTHAVRIIVQRSIKMEQVEEVREHMVMFVEEFENLYYQRKLSRLHFCRACLHSLLHTGPEIPRVGPGAYGNQYPCERTIGELGGELRQPGNPFANLMEIATRRSQINAVKVLHPELDHDRPTLPKYAKDAGDNYTFLRPRQTSKRDWDSTDQGIRDTIEESTNMVKVSKWGRLKLPNGQICRSYFCESNRKRVHQRISRNIKVEIDAKIQYAEVQFFFFIPKPNSEDLVPKAIISLYNDPDPELLRLSYQALKVCAFEHLENLVVVDVKQILSVVSMQPMPEWTGFFGKWFVVEKSGIEDVELAGYEEAMEDEPMPGEDLD